MIVVASGGMYLERLDVDALQPSPSDYDGVRAYSRAKRAQVALAEEWTTSPRRHAGDRERHAPRLGGHARAAERPPGFSRTLAPLLRTPRQGADTIAWLAAAPEVAGRSGLFFLDRRARPTHRRRGTRRLDEAQRTRAALGALSERDRVVQRPRQRQLNVAQRTRPEPRLAEGEIEVPGALEGAVVAERAHLVDALVDVRAPAPKRLGVVRADLVDVVASSAATTRVAACVSAVSEGIRQPGNTYCSIQSGDLR